MLIIMFISIDLTIIIVIAALINMIIIIIIITIIHAITKYQNLLRDIC